MQLRRVEEHGEQIIALQVLIVGKDLIYRPPDANKLQQCLHRVPKTSDNGLLVAYLCVKGNALTIVIIGSWV